MLAGTLAHRQKNETPHSKVRRLRPVRIQAWQSGHTSPIFPDPGFAQRAHEAGTNARACLALSSGCVAGAPHLSQTT